MKLEARIVKCAFATVVVSMACGLLIFFGRLAMKHAKLPLSVRVLFTRDPFSLIIFIYRLICVLASYSIEKRELVEFLGASCVLNTTQSIESGIRDACVTIHDASCLCLPFQMSLSFVFESLLGCF